MNKITMSFVVIITMMVISLVVSLPLGVIAAERNTGPQSWSFDSEPVETDVSRMEKNYGSGDDGQSGFVTIPGTPGLNYHIWVSDQKAETGVSYSGGGWVFLISSTSQWGNQGSLCDIEIGYWDGSFHSLSDSTVSNHRSKGNYIGVTLIMEKSITVPEDTFLAVKVINNTGSRRVVKTGENTSNSYFRSPETDPGFPVPELSASILVSLGIIVLVAFIYWRLKKRSLTNISGSR